MFTMNQTYLMNIKPYIILKLKNQKGNILFGRKVVHHGVQQYTYLTYPIDFPFEIQSGKIKYIGEINFKKDETFEINDKSERDLNKLKEMFPTLIIEK